MKTLKYTLCAMLTLLAIGTHAQNNPPVANDDVDSTGSGNGGIIFVLNNHMRMPYHGFLFLGSLQMIHYEAPCGHFE